MLYKMPEKKKLYISHPIIKGTQTCHYIQENCQEAVLRMGGMGTEKVEITATP